MVINYYKYMSGH